MLSIIGIAPNLDENRLKMPIFSLPRAYAAAIVKAGGVPVILPVNGEAAMSEKLAQRIDGLLLPGGIDLDPDWYNEAPKAELEEVNRDLDICQLEMLKAVIAEKKPVLGICRGCQLINAFFGGSLYQDINSQYAKTLLPHRGKGYDTEHPVTFIEDSRLHRLFGPEMVVNSRHHQAIKDIGAGLVVTGVAADGVIEAAEHRQLPVHLVQWHPERMLLKGDSMLPLFQEFIDTCKKQ